MLRYFLPTVPFPMLRFYSEKASFTKTKYMSITQKNIFLINDAGKKEKHLFNKFRRIEFVDLKGQNRVFERPLEKFGMFELIQDGPKKCVRPFAGLF